MGWFEGKGGSDPLAKMALSAGDGTRSCGELRVVMAGRMREKWTRSCSGFVWGGEMRRATT